MYSFKNTYIGSSYLFIYLNVHIDKLFNSMQIHKKNLLDKKNKDKK